MLNESSHLDALSKDTRDFILKIYNDSIVNNLYIAICIHDFTSYCIPLENWVKIHDIITHSDVEKYAKKYGFNKLKSDKSNDDFIVYEYWSEDENDDSKCELCLGEISKLKDIQYFTYEAHDNDSFDSCLLLFIKKNNMEIEYIRTIVAGMFIMDYGSLTSTGFVKALENAEKDNAEHKKVLNKIIESWKDKAQMLRQN